MTFNRPSLDSQVPFIEIQPSSWSIFHSLPILLIFVSSFSEPQFWIRQLSLLRSWRNELHCLAIYFFLLSLLIIQRLFNKWLSLRSPVREERSLYFQGYLPFIILSNLVTLLILFSLFFNLRHSSCVLSLYTIKN